MSLTSRQVVPLTSVNICLVSDSWHVDWVSDDFMALPELVSVMYENQRYHRKFKYITGAARDDAAYMICNCYLLFNRKVES